MSNSMLRENLKKAKQVIREKDQEIKGLKDAINNAGGGFVNWRTEAKKATLKHEKLLREHKRICCQKFINGLLIGFVAMKVILTVYYLFVC